MAINTPIGKNKKEKLMSTSHIYLDGQVMWAKVHSPDPKYKNYTVDFYPDDLEDAREKLEEMGSQLDEREANHADSPGPFFYKFRREESRLMGDQLVKFGKPLVVKADGVTPETKLLGNGTKVTVKVEFFDTKNGVGHRLLAVKVNELVPYEQPEGPREVKHLPF